MDIATISTLGSLLVGFVVVFFALDQRREKGDTVIAAKIDKILEALATKAEKSEIAKSDARNEHQFTQARTEMKGEIAKSDARNEHQFTQVGGKISGLRGELKGEIAKSDARNERQFSQVRGEISKIGTVLLDLVKAVGRIEGRLEGRLEGRSGPQAPAAGEPEAAPAKAEAAAKPEAPGAEPETAAEPQAATG